MSTGNPQKIGKYDVLKELGRGATSTVYLARDPFADRQVAIKRVNAEALNDPKYGKLYRKQLFTEASLAGKLNHPHITAIYDAVLDEEESYIVMEYVDGGTLEKVAQIDAVPALQRVVEIIFKCCKALEFAQHQGVIHRDIKPANVMLTADGDIKISDFGAALLPQMDTTQVSGIGSPAYMSPQQVKEFPLNHQTDIFSLGVVMYQLVTGRLPFQATSNASMIYQILNIDPPPPSTYRPGVPEEMDRVVAKAMHKDPELRYQTWRDFAEDLATLGHIETAEQDITDTAKFSMLRGLSFFKGFSDVELWEVLRISRWDKHPPHSILVAEGEVGTSFSLMAQGEAKVIKGKRLLNILNSGDCFGEMAYIARPSSIRTATVESITEATVVTIDASALEQSSENCQLRFNRAFLNILVERLDLANTRLSMLLS